MGMASGVLLRNVAFKILLLAVRRCATSVATVDASVRGPATTIVRIRVANTVRAYTLGDATIIAIVLWPIFHVMVTHVVYRAALPNTGRGVVREKALFGLMRSPLGRRSVNAHFP
jgi:hypothetical protein